MFGGNNSVNAGIRTPKMAAGSSVGFSSSGFKSPTKVRQERQTNFKVVIRVRPPLPRELTGEVPFRNVIAVDDREQCITVSENIEAVVDSEGQVLANPGPYTTYSFMFDYVYDQNSTQEKVYETTARTVVASALQGYNATIFAYGQTGSGKTYTMEGFNREGNIEARGIIPRAIEQIFGHIQSHASPRMRFLVRASYLQIYNEQISDLLKPDRNNLQIREDKRRGVYVDGLSEWVVRSPAEIYGLMERGAAVRATGETKMNEVSSRSHAVFIVIAEQSETVYVDDNGVEMTPEDFQSFMHSRGVRSQQEMSRLEDHVRQTFKVGKLNLVDLAGSERVQRSGATGLRLEESKQINKSLSMLGYVISALTEAKDRQHVPYRNSKLTRMLEDSLGGNCKTTMMAMISPAFEAMLETISTLKFANRAKNIKNEAKVNEDLDQKSLLRKYERELKKLRAELEEKNKNVVDKRRLLELDEQRRRAEADKIAAIRALEARSIEFMKEKEEKKKLEQRIAMLMGQMIRAGDNKSVADFSSNVPAGSSPSNVYDNMNTENEIIMKEQQDKLRQEYEFKLAGLERERETIEEEKAQVDRYKQLLLKQRDIMIALTQRLVERDEQIMALQDELDAYDRHHKELEEKLDEKTAQLIKLQRISMEVSATSPYKNEELNKALENSWSQEERSQRKNGGATELLSEEGDENPANEEENIVSTTASNSGAVGGGDSTTGTTGTKTDQSKKSSSGGNAATIHREYEEKLKEYSNLIENQRQQILTLETKITEQHLSASRIEKVFNSEIDAYLKEVPNDSVRSNLRDALKSVTNQATRKLKDSNLLPPSPYQTEQQLELHRLREENERLKAGRATTTSQLSSENSNLKVRCDTLVKEREAVQTIMEHKIKVLVQSVAQAAGAVVNASPAGNGPAGQALAKDVAALQKLVNASIAALRNAANTSSNAGTSSSSQSMPPVPVPVPSPPATLQQGNNGEFTSSSGRYAPLPGGMNTALPSNYSGGSFAQNYGPALTASTNVVRASFPSTGNQSIGPPLNGGIGGTGTDPFSYRNLLAGGGGTAVNK